MAFWEGWCGGKGDGCCDDCSWTQLAIWAAAIVVVGGLITVLVLAFGVVFPPKATADDAVLQRFALAPADPASNSISFNVRGTSCSGRPSARQRRGSRCGRLRCLRRPPTSAAGRLRPPPRRRLAGPSSPSRDLTTVFRSLPPKKRIRVV